MSTFFSKLIFNAIENAKKFVIILVLTHFNFHAALLYIQIFCRVDFSNGLLSEKIKERAEKFNLHVPLSYGKIKDDEETEVSKQKSIKENKQGNRRKCKSYKLL